MKLLDLVPRVIPLNVVPVMVVLIIVVKVVKIMVVMDVILILSSAHTVMMVFGLTIRDHMMIVHLVITQNVLLVIGMHKTVF